MTKTTTWPTVRKYDGATYKLGTHDAAWSFMRALDAAGIPVGFPSLGAPFTVSVSIRTNEDRIVADKLANGAEVIAYAFADVVTVQVTRTQRVRVASFAEASALIRAHWGDQSSRDFYATPNAGTITVNGVSFAHVSYNGRVWEGLDRGSSSNVEIVAEVA